MEFNSSDIGWPEDTIIFSYNSVSTLLMVVQQLTVLGFIFVVSPKHGAVAMSKDAARAIGAYV